jgi:hypothetical protein
VVNLITNSSFEINGQKSLSGWIIYCDNPSFVNDVPPGGGNWALELPTGWIPFSNWVETTVLSPVGSHEYQFSIYGKKNGHTGNAQLYLKRADSLIFCNRLTVIDTVWTYYSASDTLTTYTGDSLYVRILMTGTEDPVSCYFDLCKLEKLN